MSSLDGKNHNPIIATPQHQRKDFEYIRRQLELDDQQEDEIDAYEGNIHSEINHACVVFDMLRHINDPEHPLSLEQLNVIRPELITV